MTSSCELLVVASPGLLPAADGVQDLRRQLRVPLDEDGRRVLALLAAGPLPLSLLWPGVDGLAAGQRLGRLADLGLVDVVVTRRLRLAVLRGGSPAELRRLLSLGTRRRDVAGSPVAVLAGCLVVVAVARRAVLALAAAIAVGLALLLPHPTPWRVLDAALAPALFAATLAAHEAGHLLALRRLPGRHQAGALVVGTLGLAVLRPTLTGRPLRMVAVAGPLAGMAVSLPAAGLSFDAPACGLAGLVGLALHAANLLPGAPDARQLWRGHEDAPPGMRISQPA